MKKKLFMSISATIVAGIFGIHSSQAQTFGQGNLATGAGCVAAGIAGGCTDTYVGDAAGAVTTGGNNTFIGQHAGLINTTGGDNTCLGALTGRSSITASEQTLVGYKAGNLLTGGNNTCVGSAAGQASTTATSCAFFGFNAGSVNTTGSTNTCLGNSANVGAAGLTNATSVGNTASVCLSNTMVFGNQLVTRWGFGVCAAFGHAMEVGFNAGNGNGAFLTMGGVWTNTSARAKKEDFQKQDINVMLDKVRGLEVTKWKYKGSENEYHYGPMAEDFYRLFEVGDGKSISDMDKTGVLFLAVQALDANGALQQKQIEAKDEAIKSLQSAVGSLQNENTALKSRLDKFESALSECCMNFKSGAVSSGSVENDLANLEQNIPNPFSQNTTIKFFIPQNAGSCVLKVYSLDGSELKSIAVETKGFGQAEISGKTLAAGTYTYMLLVDGKVVDSKQMVLTK